MSATDNKTWSVYLLRLRDGSLYCGCTNDLNRRLAAHAAGRGSRLVHARLPFVLVYHERIPFPGGRSEAQKREAAIKRMSKHKKEQLCSS